MSGEVRVSIQFENARKEPLPAKRVGGRLILVVGPSGAGKDTLINRARAALANDASFVFVRRVVTRPSSVWEEHDSVTPQAFAEALAAGEFALAWKAHGLDYGLPRTIEEAMAAGHSVVCNVSRRIIAAARQRYTDVKVVYVDAPADVLAQRLRARGRETDVEHREQRQTGFAAPEADVVIDNGGDIETAVTAFLRALAE
jgi:ribose 1,5-bisphosphokinase